MKRVILYISYTIVILALLSLFGNAAIYVAGGGKKFGVLSKPFKAFVLFPKQMLNTIRYVSEIPEYCFQPDEAFKVKNLVNSKLFALEAKHDPAGYQYILYDLGSDSVYHEWLFSKENYNGMPEQFQASIPLNPILLPGRNLIGMLNMSKNLFRLDGESNIVWHNKDLTVHHAMNLDHDSNLWVCSNNVRYTISERENMIIDFIDDHITKIDIETGEVLNSISLSDIFIDNGYISMVHGFGNEEISHGKDMYHLNDIEPAIDDGKFWKKGDLFLSLRHRSLVLLYRPSTNEILRMITGPFLSQHDVDIISDTKISVFNNNRTHTTAVKQPEILDSTLIKLNLRGSEIIIYDFVDSTFQKPYQNQMLNEQVFTKRSGTHTYLENGSVFIEATERGKYFLLSKNRTLMRRYPLWNSDGTVEIPHWTRIYEKIDL